jgi:hypothetical protein
LCLDLDVVNFTRTDVLLDEIEAVGTDVKQHLVQQARGRRARHLSGIRPDIDFRAIAELGAQPCRYDVLYGVEYYDAWGCSYAVNKDTD